MKASTVFAIALSLLVGLGAAAVAKYAGVFDKKEPPAPPPPPPADKILVARINLYEDIAVTADQVSVREISADESRYFKMQYGDNWKTKLMPPLVMTAHLLIPKRNIGADQPLFRADFQDSNLPDSLSNRLEPGTRAVTIQVSKDKAGGGVIRTGEYVDVLLTTKVGMGVSEEAKELKTATIARGLKVVMKRNTLWPIMQADPDDQPLKFTLQANPYRAALLAYAQTHGDLSLIPVPPPPKMPPGTWSDPTSKEYADEDRRVEMMTRGELTIGDYDLARIFKVVPLPPPAQPIQTKHIVGASYAGMSVFPPPAPTYPAGNGNGTQPASGTNPGNGGVAPAGGTPPAGPAAPGGGNGPMSAAPGNGAGYQPVGYTFSMPTSTDKECKTCPKPGKK